MLDTFSPRARQVVFVARFKAGERGATAIEVDDFIDALILEDQGILESVFFKFFEGQGTAENSAPSHVSFFSSDMAQALLSNLERSLPRSQSVPLTTEIPLSPSLEAVLNSAKSFQTRLRYQQIEPLHLLAAILKESSSEGVKMLEGSGITSEKVLLALNADSA
jgi:ATP-dependent Clp protease ATP-binding subunit ClpC